MGFIYSSGILLKNGILYWVSEFPILLAESFIESDEVAAEELIEWGKKYGEE